MHLALPTRKSSNPPPYANRSSSRYPVLRRSRIQGLIAGVVGVAALLFLLSKLLGGGESIPSGTPPVVIVTVLDAQKNTKSYLSGVKENRIDYAAKHGMIIAEKYWNPGLYVDRLCDILTRQHRIQSSRGTEIMGEDTSTTTCFDKVPS